jgi:hypothetical protein
MGIMFQIIGSRPRASIGPRKVTSFIDSLYSLYWPKYAAADEWNGSMRSRSCDCDQ